jgi:hypothetical protein
MKAAKAPTAEEQKKTTGRRKTARQDVPIPPESRRSTAAALLKHAPGWTGGDLDEVIATVRGTRAKTRF